MKLVLLGLFKRYLCNYRGILIGERLPCFAKAWQE